MAQQEEIVLWIDRRWKNAIEKHLKDETLQEHLENVLDELCNQLPQREYVACCGTSIQPVLQMLEQAPQLDTVLLCLDNDEAGHQASRRMREQLEARYSVERLIPENKDWNDDLTLSDENAQGFAMNELR